MYGYLKLVHSINFGVKFFEIHWSRYSFSTLDNRVCSVSSIEKKWIILSWRTIIRLGIWWPHSGLRFGNFIRMNKHNKLVTLFLNPDLMRKLGWLVMIPELNIPSLLVECCKSTLYANANSRGKKLKRH